MVVEINLRVFCPQYQDAARSSFENIYGFPTRKPNSHTYETHPDTLKKHLIFYNSQGLRISREIPLNKARHRIAFFGDSFVENTGLSGEYGFNEVLDYLLNSNEDKFDVINFGMNGYGTDESFLSYQRRPAAKDLDAVFYVFCSNDIMDNYEHGLASLDSKGHLVWKDQKRDVLKEFLAHFYLTYLFLEAKTNFSHFFHKKETKHSSEAMKVFDDFLNKKDSKKLKKAIELYQAILRQWSSQAPSLTVVLLPFPPEDDGEPLIPSEIKSINLHRAFGNLHPPSRKYHFLHNGHWNERANMMAAIVLYRYLEPQLGLAHKDKDWIKQRLFEYYSSFGNEWFPDFFVQEVPVSNEKKMAIYSKYKELEIQFAASSSPYLP